ncbi:MAG: phosphoadenosine phosphosulfate reductase, partial [Anaerocolumna sp.]|nr:phosphoadenosine phosphosulfate reductase [Anaerocolumna sp.]
VKYDAHYNITGIDPPEVFYQIRNTEGIIMHQHEKSIFRLIVEKLMPPTRLMRYCCEKLKEHGGEDRFNVTGVRWAESKRRATTRTEVEFDRYGSRSKNAEKTRKIFLNSDNDEKRRMLESCTIKGKHILNPIIDWTDEDVWEVIKYYNLEYPSLYDEGFCRIGCIGCPLSRKKNRLKEFKRYPKYEENYIRAFDKMIKRRLELEKPTQWKTGEEVFEWWLNG